MPKHGHKRALKHMLKHVPGRVLKHALMPALKHVLRHVPRHVLFRKDVDYPYESQIPAYEEKNRP